MKEGWTYKKLGEVCDYSIGLTYKPTDICDNGTIVLRSSNIQNGQIDLNDIVRVSCPIKDTLFVNKGDILMCSRNGSARLVGKVAIIPDIKERMTYGTFMMIIRSDYNPFLFYYFNSDIFRKQIKHGEANMINQITRYMLDDVVVSLPPLSDQQRIVSRLDAAFSHIDELKVNAEKRLSEARALFQKSLAKAMEPKESWSIDKLVEVFNFIDYRGSTPTKLNEGVPLITAKNVKFGYLDYSIKDFISREEFETRKSRGISQKGDLLFTTEAPLGNVAIADLDEFSAGQRLITLQKYKHSKYEFLNEFYYFYMLSSHFQERIKELATGATAQGIKAKILKTVIVPIPPLTEQQRIVERLDALSVHVRELEENQKRIISECDALKQALLRKVFE